ncbi:unnamed protein product [Parnassius mnemosyne]|uniref:Uncharacterized protein n=1 Tax=Parnassius mnemosyne TaxID=213953 RepID=A0AAV1M027_9NEOP
MVKKIIVISNTVLVCDLTKRSLKRWYQKRNENIKKEEQKRNEISNPPLENYINFLSYKENDLTKVLFL